MRWLQRLFRRRKAETELNEEIRFYLEQETKLRIDRGESPEQAREAARRDFGNVTLVKETTRQMWGWRLLDDLARDVRYSLRLLAHSPLFTAVAVLSLALGIGANTAIFSLADAVIFRSLPVREPERLVQVRGADQPAFAATHSYETYQEIRERNGAFSETSCAGLFTAVEPVALVFPNDSRRESRAQMTAVCGNFFHTLGAGPAIGRMFGPADDRTPGGHPVAVVSHRFWKRELGSDPSVIHSRLVHKGVSYQILGVAQAKFTGISSNEDIDVWIPVAMARAVLPPDAHVSEGPWLYVFGRLKPGASVRGASEDLRRIGGLQRLSRGPEDPHGGQGVVAGSMAKGIQMLRVRFEAPLLVLLGVVGLLLMIACSNLAALLMARAAARRHEIAMRLSLGATRGRLFRQFLTEGLLLGVLGGAGGLLLASWGAPVLVRMAAGFWPFRLPLDFAIDLRILTFTLALAMLATILFGLLPGLEVKRTRIIQTSTPSRTHARVPGGRLLVAGQMALSLILLVAAGLFVQSLGNLRSLDTGFARQNVLTVLVDPREAYGKNQDRYLATYKDLTAQVEGLPGIRSASVSSGAFFSIFFRKTGVTFEGQAGPPAELVGGLVHDAPLQIAIGPRFGETLGLKLAAGRMFTSRDDQRAPKVAIISESIARRFFEGQNPVGKRFCLGAKFEARNAIEIAGVLGDVRFGNLRQMPSEVVYLPLLQSAGAFPFELTMRTSGDPAAMTAVVQEVVRRFDPGIRIVRVATLESVFESWITENKFLALLGGIFGLMALALAAVGLFGITSYGVHRRTSEIGVRRALGASTSDVLWLILREVLTPVAVGAAFGLPAAVGASVVVRGMLFGLIPADPLTIGGAALALVLIALAAGYLPARRASRVDPMDALRCE